MCVYHFQIIHGTQEDAAGIYKCVPCESTPAKCTIVAAHLIVYRNIHTHNLFQKIRHKKPHCKEEKMSKICIFFSASHIPITTHVQVYVEPAKSYLGLGESTSIYCTSTSTNCTISWIRMDRELPANFHVRFYL